MWSEEESENPEDGSENFSDEEDGEGDELDPELDYLDGVEIVEGGDDFYGLEEGSENGEDEDLNLELVDAAFVEPSTIGKPVLNRKVIPSPLFPQHTENRGQLLTVGTESFWNKVSSSL